MFRGTATFLVIILVLNHDLTAARNIEVIAKSMSTNTEEAPLTDNEEFSVSEKTQSRRKRGWGSLIRGGLTAIAAGGFALSVGSTLYHAIRKCKDYRPSPCRDLNCQFYDACPGICQGPDTNRKFALAEKDRLKERLNELDRLQQADSDFATDTIVASLLNQRILTEIDRINQKVDQIMFDMVDMDTKISQRFKNNSKSIESLIRNEKLTLDDIVVSPEMQGIFDKWTWEGTGVFVGSLALPLGLRLFSSLRERYAIHQVYKGMKADFTQRFLNQKVSSLKGSNSGATLKNKFAYVQGYSTKKIDAQLKQSAKATFYADKANVKVTKVEKFTRNVVGPAVNAIVIALSVWSAYTQISNCQLIANDMQDTAYDVAMQRDKIEGLKKNLIDELHNNISTQAWQPIKDLVVNDTFTSWLDGIKNLTEGANNKNTEAANTIQNFIDNIEPAGVSGTIAWQKKLVKALETIEFEFACLADKTHAIAIVLKDCRLGKDQYSTLYADANSKYKLNRKACVDSKMVPYTTPEEFFETVNKTADHQGWYSNCLLNDGDLLIRVCGEKLLGYIPSQIVTRVNKSELNEDIVNNFLTRCPPPEITPKSQNDTCNYYCLYLTPEEISKRVALFVSQVNTIIDSCAICNVRDDQLAKICTLYFCKGENSTSIGKTVRLPKPTVDDTISKKCVQKCIVTIEQKKDICDQSKCKIFSADKIKKNLGLPLATINEVIAQCDTILPSCGKISDEDKKKILGPHCAFGATAAKIYEFSLVDLSLQAIQSVIDSQSCEDFLKNGVKKTP